ncbi:nuclease-related domain-containing protein [Alkaliphilus sp. B6464]|uniref:nuclease-related domain-containing protein n=1 Tax=Alkaliphilus sp. B6464 TaxID=2731219 RepID=UPI001BA93688|nr:nuclease-related domain-containing protein [Alkaliphilus sp. B6464]QUH20414.1 NERD domain-containing protein [Alkaliphilus sp. B6464]
MAQMFPPTIEGFQEEHHSEIEFFSFLKLRLPDNYYVFWNIRVNKRKPDFIIVGPDLGLVVLEVKDWALGTISRSDLKKYYFKPYGVSEINPYEKAETFREKVEEALCEEIGLLQQDGIYKNRIKFSRASGVVFTNINRIDFESSTHRNSIDSEFILFKNDIQNIKTPEQLIKKLKAMFVPEKSFYFEPLSLDDMSLVRKVLFRDSIFYTELDTKIIDAGYDVENDLVESYTSSTDVTGDVKEEVMLEYLNHKRKFPFKKIIFSLFVLTFLASLPYLHKIVESYEYQGKSISEYIGSLFNSNINVLGKNSEENIDLFPPTMILKVQNNPYGKGTYILIQDGKNYISSKTFPKDSYIEFYNDRKIIIYNSKTSETKEFIAENDVIKLEVGNAYTKIYLNGIEHKFVKNFKYNFIDNKIVN